MKLSLTEEGVEEFVVSLWRQCRRLSSKGPEEPSYAERMVDNRTKCIQWGACALIALVLDMQEPNERGHIWWPQIIYKKEIENIAYTIVKEAAKKFGITDEPPYEEIILEADKMLTEREEAHLALARAENPQSCILNIPDTLTHPVSKLAPELSTKKPHSPRAA